MSATATVPTTTAITSTIPAECSGQTRSLWRTGLVAGVAAAAATVAVAAIAQGLDVSLEVAPGEAIPLVGFAQLTLLCTAVGVFIARTVGRRGTHPRTTFVRATVVLTALSLVPDLVLSAGSATKVALMLTHVVAAAIVIPVLSSCLPERGKS